MLGIPQGKCNFLFKFEVHFSRESYRSGLPLLPPDPVRAKRSVSGRIEAETDFFRFSSGESQAILSGVAASTVVTVVSTASVRRRGLLEELPHSSSFSESRDVPLVHFFLPNYVASETAATGGAGVEATAGGRPDPPKVAILELGVRMSIRSPEPPSWETILSILGSARGDDLPPPHHSAGERCALKIPTWMGVVTGVSLNPVWVAGDLPNLRRGRGKDCTIAPCPL